MNTHPQGFALLIAVILTSVVLSVGFALASLAYKDVILASSAKGSTYAFYAADSALECALYADQKWNAFDYNSPSSTISCGGTSYSITAVSKNSATSVMTVPNTAGGELISLDGGVTCATVTIYKGAPPLGHTQIYTVGYNTCNMNDPKILQRGLKSSY